MNICKGRPFPLGVTVWENQINFAVEVPKGSPCFLMLYLKGNSNPTHRICLKEQENTGLVRFVALKDFPYEEYTYLYEINHRLVLDPRSTCVVGRTSFGRAVKEGQLRGDLRSIAFPFEEDHFPNLAPEEVIAYGLHPRGFTAHHSSQVASPGTFEGIVEKLPYIEELGVNQLHLMPVYDFDERVSGKKNYWGYGRGNFFSPKQTFSKCADGPLSLQSLVYHCHQRKIEVILYLPFVEDTFAQTILSCLRLYRQEYHIDGFVVNPYLISPNTITADPYLEGAKIYSYNDEFLRVMRCFLKGDQGMIPSFIVQQKKQGSGQMNLITNHTGYTLMDLVSYEEKHNEANLEGNQDGPLENYSWNCGVEGPTKIRSIVKLRQHQMRNAMLLLFLSQGTPMLRAGDEFLHTQKGNNNPYCQDNALTWLHWKETTVHSDMYTFVKELIAFRKKHSILHQANELTFDQKGAFGIPKISYHGESAWQLEQHDPTLRQVGIYLAGGKKEESCYLALNMHWVEHRFALPSLEEEKHWFVCITTEKGVLSCPVKLNQKEIVVPKRSIYVLMSR